MKYEICKEKKSGGVLRVIAWTDTLNYGMEIVLLLARFSDYPVALRDAETGYIIYKK